jgi:poly-gamma-glutamate synthesis protein (capsule biosynthesis protein)
MADLVAEDVRKARAEGRLVLVAFHWGGQGAGTPAPEDRLLARAVIGAGAAAVFGGGPGLVQGLEFCGDGVILYGLGPFVRQEDDPARKLGVVARLTLAGGRVQTVELVPVQNEGARPTLLTGAGRAAALRLLHERTMRLAAEPLYPSAGKASPAWYSGGRGGPDREERPDGD